MEQPPPAFWHQQLATADDLDQRFERFGHELVTRS